MNLYKCKVYCEIYTCSYNLLLVMYFSMLFILLQPPEIAEEQEDYKEHIIEDLYVYRPPVSKPWVSLGSEKEIEEESVKESTKQVRGLDMIFSVLPLYNAS